MGLCSLGMMPKLLSNMKKAPGGFICQYNAVLQYIMEASGVITVSVVTLYINL